MICEACREGADYLSDALAVHGPTFAVTLAAKSLHSACRGATACDCQHKVELQAEGKAVQRR